jgi:hypothetical protein
MQPSQLKNHPAGAFDPLFDVGCSDPNTLNPGHLADGFQKRDEG